jgi:uncharacterized small protein (DUF1192 family)
MLCSHRLRIAILNEEIEHLKSKLPKENSSVNILKATIATLQARVKELEVEEKKLDILV